MRLIEPLKKENDIKEILDMILYFMDNIPKDEFVNVSIIDLCLLLNL